MSRKISIALVLAVLAGFMGYALWSIFLAPSGLPPEGFARGNGRVEADLVDVSNRLSGRVATIAVQEGDLVAAGDVLAVMDTTELEAQKARAEAAVASAEAAVAVAQAGVTKAEASLALADSAEVRDKWPSVLEAITTHSYPMPILMVADTEGEPPFPMFRGVRGELQYLDPKEPFGHESYTSAYLMRLAGEGRFFLPDAEILHEQRRIYEALLNELSAFMRAQAGMPVQQVLYPDGDPFHRW